MSQLQIIKCQLRTESNVSVRSTVTPYGNRKLCDKSSVHSSQHSNVYGASGKTKMRSHIMQHLMTKIQVIDKTLWRHTVHGATINTRSTNRMIFNTSNIVLLTA